MITIVYNFIPSLTISILFDTSPIRVSVDEVSPENIYPIKLHESIQVCVVQKHCLSINLRCKLFSL